MKVSNIVEEHIVPDHISGVRLQEYGCGIFDTITSRKGVKKAIVKGRVLVDGAPGSTGTFVQAGMQIQLLGDESHGVVFAFELEVVYEDDDIAVINKPAGIVVSGNRLRTVQNALTSNLKSSEAADALSLPRPVHRLDEATSGLLLIAKSHSAMVSLGRQFEAGEVSKRYQAIVARKPESTGSIDTPVDGKEALTHFELIQSIPFNFFGEISLMNLFPSTGRKHQLRVHMSSIGHPIVGDPRYSDEGEYYKGKGLFLQASSLKFKHPQRSSEMHFELELPNKFKKLLKMN